MFFLFNLHLISIDELKVQVGLFYRVIKPYKFINSYFERRVDAAQEHFFRDFLSSH